MDSIIKTLSAGLASLLLCIGQAAPACISQDDNLHAQSAAAQLQARFPDPNLSYLALDNSGSVLAERWPDADSPVPIGSLIKPFLALAYARTHDYFPEYFCAGKKTCWLYRGHGKLGLRHAIGFSCNSYFHQLISDAEPDFARATLNDYHLTADSREPQRLLAESQATPMALALAYLHLALDRREPATQLVLQGMALSAQHGTAKAVAAELPSLPALAKTGTAPCIHTPKAPGDGFAVILAPRDHPRLVMLVRLHGRPGSMAAATAAKMVAAIENRETRPLR